MSEAGRLQADGANVLRLPASALRFFPTASAVVAFPGTDLPKRIPVPPLVTPKGR